MGKIAVIGGNGYVGSAFIQELRRRKLEYCAPPRSALEAGCHKSMARFLEAERPDLVIHAAGYTGKPNVDACETRRADTLIGNVCAPETAAAACEERGVPWGQVSSGCIYSGAKLWEANQWRVYKDLTPPERWRWIMNHRDRVRGFDEEDAPNFSFRDPPCSFYSGSKALAEERLEQFGRGYVWRLRIPFDENDSSRNYLSKLLRYPKIYNNVNSISHLGDFVAACLDLWMKNAEYGVYNMTNPGWITAEDATRQLLTTLAPGKRFEFWSGDEEFYRKAAKTPRSNCVLESGKLLKAGVEMRPVEEALRQALRDWRWEK